MKLTVIIAALVIALFVVLALGNFFGEPKEKNVVLAGAPQAQSAQIVQNNIIVAKRDIQIGSQITVEDYDIKPLAQQLVPAGAILADDPSQVKIEGMVTNSSIVANQPILSTMLRNPNDPGYIAGQLAEGMRAVTIRVGLTESLAGLIQPGDKVDVLYTHDITKFNAQDASVKSLKSVSDEEAEKASVNITEVLIPNLKILAIDSRVGGVVGEGQQGVTPQSVTLEVNLRDAQKLGLAQNVGKLSLVLRSIKDKDKYDIVRPTAEQDLSRILPPAYFSNLYDSDATYDFNIVDPYVGGAPEMNSIKSGKIKLYRGAELQEVEVNKK